MADNKPVFRVTDRGFAAWYFSDLYGVEISVQKSSLADKDAIWLGPDEPNAQIMAVDAIRLGLDTKGITIGWVPFYIPDEVVLTTRMHIDKEQARWLIKVLQHFVDTGELPDDETMETLTNG